MSHLKHSKTAKQIINFNLEDIDHPERFFNVYVKPLSCFVVKKEIAMEIKNDNIPVVKYQMNCGNCDLFDLNESRCTK